VRRREDLAPKPLCDGECRALFKLFAQSHREGALELPLLATLKKLPIFETRAGSFVSLTQGECFLCPAAISIDAPSEHLLVHQELALYRVLGVTELDDTAMFERFVLPRYSTLTPPQQSQACAQIKRNWPEIRQRPQVVRRSL
jgi:hypothetical protein